LIFIQFFNLCSIIFLLNIVVCCFLFFSSYGLHLLLLEQLIAALLLSSALAARKTEVCASTLLLLDRTYRSVHLRLSAVTESRLIFLFYFSFIPIFLNCLFVFYKLFLIAVCMLGRRSLNMELANFDSESSLLNNLPCFRGLENEDLYGHVRTFKEECEFVKSPNVPINLVRLQLFPFSLHDRAKAYLYNMRPKSITSWEMMQNKFYHKFFPIAKIKDYHLKISNFRQKEGERFTDSWEKFKELTMKCPPHGFENETIVQYFYRGLTPSERNSLEIMNDK
jgi:hypothetical protein